MNYNTDPEAEDQEFYFCDECGERVRVEDCEEEPKDCIDHAPVAELPEMLENPLVTWHGVNLARDLYVEASDYDRCKRALDRAVKELKAAREQLKAAPDMLEALKQVVDLRGISGFATEEELRRRQAIIDAAIKKAEGR